jgi:hypothetical protein
MKFRRRNLGALGDLICGNLGSRSPEGDEEPAYFPYRSSTFITEFFDDLDMEWVHDGSTLNSPGALPTPPGTSPKPPPSVDTKRSARRDISGGLAQSAGHNRWTTVGGNLECQLSFGWPRADQRTRQPVASICIAHPGWRDIGLSNEMSGGHGLATLGG